MRKIWVIAVVLLIVLIAIAAAIWLGTPRLSSWSPQDGAENVPASTPLRLSFTRQMQSDTVIARLKITPPINGAYSWEGRTLIFTPDHPWPAGTAIQVHLSQGAQAKGWLELAMQTDSDWIFTIRQPHILYQYPADGAANIYLFDPLTQESRLITDLLAGVQEFDATPEGQTIYYSVKNNLNGSDIYRLTLNPDLTVNQSSLILACKQVQCRAPSISPGEDYLAYERTSPAGSDQPGYPQVWLAKLTMTAAESGGSLVTAAEDQILAGDHAHQTIQPDWSANGILSFFDTNQQAFIILDPSSGENTSLPNQTGEPGSWDPGSAFYVAPEIFFNSSGAPQTTPELKPIASSHLLKYNLEEGSIQDLTKTEGLEDTSPAVSPNGSLLAFARKYLDITNWTPGRQLWVMKPDGADAHQLTHSPENNHYAFTWSPSGNQIAFVRFNLDAPLEQPAIWMYDIEKDYELELIPGGYSPIWIP